MKFCWNILRLWNCHQFSQVFHSGHFSESICDLSGSNVTGVELQGTKLSGLELSGANRKLGLSCHESKCHVTFWCVWLCARCTVVALHIGYIKRLFLLSPPSHWQKSFATPVCVLQLLVANWKKYSHKFHWQRGFLALATAVRLVQIRFEGSKLNAIAKAKTPLCQWNLLEILCCRFMN